ncbi:MAG: glucuronate isomerase [Clostridia bacterium]|nr:glucuronate isomerase [Clostridia bacterium]
MKDDTQMPCVCAAGDALLPCAFSPFSAEKILAGRAFDNLAEIWFPDLRKHRALRALGLPECEITGNSSDYDKLCAFLSVLPQLGGTTLYDDARADLLALGCTLTPNAENASAIWQETTRYLCEHRVSPADVCAEKRTTFVDFLPQTAWEIHRLPSAAVPVMSCDALADLCGAAFATCIDTVSKNSGIRIESMADLEQALLVALDVAFAGGCRAVSVDLSDLFRFVRPDPYHADLALKRALAGDAGKLTEEELLLFRAQLLRTLGGALVRRGGRLLLSFSRQTDTVYTPFSPKAVKELLSDLDARGALVPTCLSLAPTDVTAGIAPLFGAFAASDGTPRLFFGIAGQGATRADLAGAWRLFCRQGATSLCLGVTDVSRGFLLHRGVARLAAAVAAETADWADNGADFSKKTPPCEAICSDISLRAAAFFGAER